MTPESLAALHEAAQDGERGWTAEEFAALLASPHVWLIAGGMSLLLARAVAGEAEVLTLATHPSARRRGRARALLADFERQALARGADRAFLEVAADNAPARALYLSAGWREAGLRRGYYPRAGGAADAVVMERALRDGPSAGLPSPPGSASCP